MTCRSYQWTVHVLQRMFQRGVAHADVIASIENGELVEDYPDDFPHPSRLVLHWHRGRPLHIVVATPPDGACIVVTVYEPSNVKWLDDFRTRRPK